VIWYSLITLPKFQVKDRTSEVSDERGGDAP
jgi:hypothetical protein